MALRGETGVVARVAEGDQAAAVALHVDLCDWAHVRLEEFCHLQNTARAVAASDEIWWALVAYGPRLREPGKLWLLRLWMRALFTVVKVTPRPVTDAATGALTSQWPQPRWRLSQGGGPLDEEFRLATRSPDSALQQAQHSLPNPEPQPSEPTQPLWQSSDWPLYHWIATAPSPGW